MEVEVIKENNDIKTVIRTNENGKVREEVYKGPEAEAKLQEIRKEQNTNEPKDHALEVESVYAPSSLISTRAPSWA